MSRAETLRIIYREQSKATQLNSNDKETQEGHIDAGQNESREKDTTEETPEKISPLLIYIKERERRFTYKAS